MDVVAICEKCGGWLIYDYAMNKIDCDCCEFEIKDAY